MEVRKRNPKVGRFFGEYYIEGLIGKGSFGSVFRAINVMEAMNAPSERSDLAHMKVALKIIPMGKNAITTYQEELAAYKVLSSKGDCSPFVVCLLDHGNYVPSRDGLSEENRRKAMEMGIIHSARLPSNISQRAFYLVSELMDGDMEHFDETIMDFTEESSPRQWWSDHPKAFLEMVSKFIQGLDYIHSKNMAHRDIKPANMLYLFPEEEAGDLETISRYLAVPDNGVTINYLYGDLGFTCTDAVHYEEFEEPHLNLCKIKNNTPLYFSPEGIKLRQQGREKLVLFIAQKTDVWALGISLWKIFFGDLPPFLKDLKTYPELKAVLSSISEADVKEMFERNPVVTNDITISKKISMVLSGFMHPLPTHRMTLSEARKILEDVDLIY